MFQAFIFLIFAVRDNKKAVEFAQEIEDHLVESLKRTCDTLDAIGKVSTTAMRCCISALNTAPTQNRAEMVCLSKTIATLVGFGTSNCPVCPTSLGVPTVG